MMKIDLLLSTNTSYRQAVARGHKYSSFAPQSLARLASLVPSELNAEVRLTDLSQAPLPRALEKSDLVGISTITCGAAYAYRVADSLREQGVTVVLGGAHPTALPEEAERHADSVVVGYGEKSWPRLLQDFRGGSLLKRYTDFSDPFTCAPAIISKNIHKGKGYFFSASLEYARGCPNSCAFCVVSSLNGGAIYRKSVEDTMEEIARLGKRVLFLDSNFTEDVEAVKPLWQAMGRRGIRWYAAGSLKFAADKEAVRYAAKNGCRGLLLGFESVNPASLAGCLKDFNQPARYCEHIKNLHDNGIQVLGCFVFGFDTDTPDVFARTVELVQKARIDIVRYAVITPFPGTPFFRQLEAENRIIDYDWDHYDTEHVVFRPRGMSREELYNGHLWAYRETYRFANIRERLSARFSPVAFMANLSFRNLAYTFNHSHQPADKDTGTVVPG